MLEGFGWRGTFYVSGALAGRTQYGKAMFRQEVLPEILGRGHEIGDHTFDHVDPFEYSIGTIRQSVKQSRLFLRELG